MAHNLNSVFKAPNVYIFRFDRSERMHHLLLLRMARTDQKDSLKRMASNAPCPHSGRNCRSHQWLYFVSEVLLGLLIEKDIFRLPETWYKNGY